MKKLPFLILGNMADSVDKSTKYCSFCGQGNKSRAKHAHVSYTRLALTRKDRKLEKQWRWVDK